MALICVCFGLRISEALALKWSDVDWLNGRLRVERGIVCQIVDDVKTSESPRALHIDSDMLDTLKLWKQTTQFSGPNDWMFASPVQIRRLPWSYDQVWRTYQRQALRPESADSALTRCVTRIGHGLTLSELPWLSSKS
jgi:integrase